MQVRLSVRRREREWSVIKVWRWLEKNHPIIYEAIWWGVLAMNFATLIILCIILLLVRKG